MARYALDIETNMQHSEIWLACCADLDTGEMTCHREPASLRSVLADASLICAHNGVAFDLAMLNRLWSMEIPLSLCEDTLLMSRLLNPAMAGGHSLEAWGQRLKFPKSEFNDFDSGWSQEMEDYCKQDVRLLMKVHKSVRQGLADAKFSEQSIRLEHDVAIIIEAQVRRGVAFDNINAQTMMEGMQLEFDDLLARLHIAFPPAPLEMKTKTKYIEFNPGSRVQIGKRLQALGWKPTELTETGRPKIDEETLKGSKIPEVKLIQRYLLLEKRIGQLRQWIEATKDGRIHGKVITNGAITSRMTHMSPNLGQVPNSGSEYGPECRDLFHPSEGKVLVGADAKGLELRMLAHYMNDPDYTHLVCEGDVHEKNRVAAGLPTRDNAKTFIYGYLYGAGDEKIGKIVGGTKKTGAKLKAQFLANTPALVALKRKLKPYADKGYMPGLDGRKIWVRHQHAALNTLLQGAGAIVMKQALVIADKRLREAGIPPDFVLNVHDEFQMEADPEVANQAGLILVAAIVEAGVTLNLRCPLDGDFKVGKSWKETH